MNDFEHALQVALALALMFMSCRHFGLVRRHERCKAALERVATERDQLRKSAWERSQQPEQG